MFLSSNGVIDLADYRFLPELEGIEDKREWCYFMKRARGHYACADLDEERSFLANWVWAAQEGETEIEKLIYHGYLEGPVLTPYLRFCIETSSLEQFVVLDLGCGVTSEITGVFATVPAGRAFRHGMLGDTCEVNVLSRSVLDTGDLEIFEPTDRAQECYLENHIEDRLHSIHNLLMDEINRSDTNCQECENPCSFVKSMSELRWEKLSAELGFDEFDLRDVIEYLSETESREGYESPLEVSDDLGISKMYIDKILETLHKDGVIDRKNSGRISERGTPYPCTVYKLKKNWEELIVKRFFMPQP